METSNYYIEGLIRRIMDKNGVEGGIPITDPVVSSETIAIIGRKGCGKTTTLHTLYKCFYNSNGIYRKELRSDGVEEITYEYFGIRLSILDLPGWVNDTRDNDEVLSLYESVLPESDLIIYIIDSSGDSIADDFEIIRDMIIPMAKDSKKTPSIAITFNKIDAIGLTSHKYKTNTENHWDSVKNEPTPALVKLIKESFENICDKLISYEIFDYIDKQITLYSAQYAYNIDSILKLLLSSRRKGEPWKNPDIIAKWSGHRL